MNRGEEDYIKALFKIENNKDPVEFVANQDLVNYFGHTIQTVNEMIKKLVAKKLVSYTPYKGSILSEKGRYIASDMLRKHRLWEMFLVEKLGYSWADVHEEAERLEHVTSDLLLERLNEFLGEPEKCPHGNTIPKAKEILKQESLKSLIDAKLSKTFSISSIKDERALLEKLSKNKLTIGSKFKVIEIDNLEQQIYIETNLSQVTLTFRDAENIYII